MQKPFTAIWRRRRLPSLLAAVAMVSVVACDSSTSDSGDIASVAVSPTTPTLNIGQTTRLVATPTTAGGRIVERTVSWQTSNAGVATVDANGVVTAVAGGTAEITATAGGESGTASVTVWFPVQSVALAPAPGQLQTIRQEAATQLAATILDTQGAAAPTRQLLWTSSNTNVATVSTSGLVSAKGINGTTTITATSLVGGVQGTLDITVSGSPVVAQVTVAPASTLIGTGQTIQAEAEATAGSGTVIGDAVFTWESDDEDIATVSATGLVTAVDVGTAEISATAEAVTGTGTFTVLTNMAEGANNIATINDGPSPGGFRDYALHVPEGTAMLTISTTATGGDLDLYVFDIGDAPGAFSGSGFANYLCRPFMVGSTETCELEAPAAGVYRVRIHGWPGEGNVTGAVATVTITPEPPE